MSILVDKSAQRAACASLALFAASASHAQEAAGSAAEQFFTLCGGKGISAAEQLPGEEVTGDAIPRFFESDVKRSDGNYRVTRLGNGFAMRAVMPSDMDPNTMLVKCAYATNQASYDRTLAALVQATGAKPFEPGGKDQSRRAMFMSADAPLQVFEEGKGWVSVYRIDVLISARGIDPRYLKQGAKPVPVPQAR